MKCFAFAIKLFELKTEVLKFCDFSSIYTFYIINKTLPC
jgi:hypothetical protein